MDQPTQSDPRAIVLSLDAGAIRARMDNLDAEHDALCVLLKAAEARDRAIEAAASRTGAATHG
jgi:hypothetical protein